MRRANAFTLFLVTALTLLFTAGLVPTANAAVDDVLFGAAGSQTMIDFSTIDASNFSNTFTYNGATTSSLTIGGNIEAQIGAIYDGGTEGNIE